MIKKLLLIIAVFLGAISASAALPFDKYTIDRKDLPEAAREMLDEHFSQGQGEHDKGRQASPEENRL